jgi:hypothetical protein
VATEDLGTGLRAGRLPRDRNLYAQIFALLT